VRAIVKSTPTAGFDYRNDVPDAESRQVRIEVAAASICGTDRELVTHRSCTGVRTPAARHARPRILGHRH
jgi:threonine 3-dehydrogenase